MEVGDVGDVDDVGDVGDMGGVMLMQESELQQEDSPDHGRAGGHKGIYRRNQGTWAGSPSLISGGTGGAGEGKRSSPEPRNKAEERLESMLTGSTFLK